MSTPTKNHRRSFAITLLFVCLLSPSSFSNEVFEHKNIKKSKYYTGTANAASLTAYRLEDWLEHRKLDEDPKHILDRGFLIDDSEVVKPLYSIADRLLAGWPGEAPNLAIFVKVGQPLTVYGGETLIADEILISRGTLEHAETDDELAAVIAHELAHVLLGHNKKNKNVLMAEQVFDYYESGKQLHEIIQGTEVSKKLDGQYNLEIKEGFLKGMLQASAQRRRASVVYQAYHSSFFSRGAEVEADRLAVDLLVASNYSVVGLQDSLERLSSSFEVEQLVNKTLTLSAESLVQETKVQLLDQLASYDELGEFGDLDSALDKMNDSMVKTFKKQAKSAVVGFFKSAHPVPAKRKAKYANYVTESFGLDVTLRQAKLDQAAVYKRGRVKQLLARYDSAFAAAELLEQEDLNAAAAMATKGISGETANAAFTRYAAYLVRSYQQDQRRASINATRIHSYLHVPNGKLAEMTLDMARQGHLKNAGNAISTKESYAGTIPEFYPTKIELAIQSKDSDTAVELALECVSASKIDQQIKDTCHNFGLLNNTAAGKKGGLFGLIQSTVDGVNSLKKGLNKEGEQ